MTEPHWSAELPVAFSDPTYLAAVVDLLGAIAYGEMSAFERLSEDAKMAPTLEDKAFSAHARAELERVLEFGRRESEAVFSLVRSRLG